MALGLAKCGETHMIRGIITLLWTAKEAYLKQTTLNHY